MDTSLQKSIAQIHFKVKPTTSKKTYLLRWMLDEVWKIVGNTVGTESSTHSFSTFKGNGHWEYSYCCYCGSPILRTRGNVRKCVDREFGEIGNQNVVCVVSIIDSWERKRKKSEEEKEGKCNNIPYTVCTYQVHGLRLVSNLFLSFPFISLFVTFSLS